MRFDELMRPAPRSSESPVLRYSHGLPEDIYRAFVRPETRPHTPCNVSASASKADSPPFPKVFIRLR